MSGIDAPIVISLDEDEPVDEPAHAVRPETASSAITPAAALM